MEKKKNNYRYLKAYPRIPGVNGICNIGFLEKRAGKRDAQENQICPLREGYITPYIDNEVRLYNSYIDKVYLKTSIKLEPVVKEASSLVIELMLMYAEKKSDMAGDGEEEQRQAAFAAARREEREQRKMEILTRIAEIKAESNMVDESLKHHIERAEGILHAHVSRYWRGVLAASSEKLEHFPCLTQENHVGRIAYEENRMRLVTTIDEAITYGGGSL